VPELAVAGRASFRVPWENSGQVSASRPPPEVLDLENLQKMVPHSKTTDEGRLEGPSRTLGDEDPYVVGSETSLMTQAFGFGKPLGDNSRSFFVGPEEDTKAFSCPVTAVDYPQGSYAPT
ncbi:unnamed protein product, partial [Cyprideis torosa]